MTTAEIDLGPIRITGVTRFNDAGTDKHVLKLAIGVSVVEVITSPTGRSIVVNVNGERLVPEGNYE